MTIKKEGRFGAPLFWCLEMFYIGCLSGDGPVMVLWKCRILLLADGFPNQRYHIGVVMPAGEVF